MTTEKIWPPFESSASCWYQATTQWPSCYCFVCLNLGSTRIHFKTRPLKNLFLSLIISPPSILSPLFLHPPITQRPLFILSQDPSLVFLSSSPPPHPSIPTSIWPFISSHCNLPSLPPSRSFTPTCAFLPLSPSLFPPPSLCPLSPVIPGSVSASGLSALKLSQRRSVAGRNPALRGNYLPHGLQQHTWTHIHTGCYSIPADLYRHTDISSIAGKVSELNPMVCTVSVQTFICTCVCLFFCVILREMSGPVSSASSLLC